MKPLSHPDVLSMAVYSPNANQANFNFMRGQKIVLESVIIVYIHF